MDGGSEIGDWSEGLGLEDEIGADVLEESDFVGEEEGGVGFVGGEEEEAGGYGDDRGEVENPPPTLWVSIFDMSQDDL